MSLFTFLVVQTNVRLHVFLFFCRKEEDPVDSCNLIEQGFVDFVDLRILFFFSSFSFSLRRLFASLAPNFDVNSSEKSWPCFCIDQSFVVVLSVIVTILRLHSFFFFHSLASFQFLTSREKVFGERVYEIIVFFSIVERLKLSR